jgi:hypothetical protein
VFPAGRAALLGEAADNQAPEDILAVLRRLPENQEFQTVAEVWAAHVGAPEDELEQRF